MSNHKARLAKPCWCAWTPPLWLLSWFTSHYLCPVCILPIEFKAHGKYLSFGQWGGKSYRLVAKTHGRIRDCRTLYLGWHGPTTWYGIKSSEVSDLRLTSGQMNQLQGWLETLCDSDRGFGPLGWICQPGDDVFVTDPLLFWNKEASKASYSGMTHDVWIAQVDGVLPSWEGVLKLDN